MHSGRRRLILLTLIVGGTWLVLFDRLRAVESRRLLLDLEPRITAMGEALIRDEWAGVYLDGQKVGCRHMTQARGNTDAHERYVVQSRSNLILTLLGSEHPLVLHNTVSLDDELRPKHFRSILAMPYQRVEVRGDVRPTAIYLRHVAGHASQEREIPLTFEQREKLVLSDTLRFRILSEGLEPGRLHRFYLFDPILLAPPEAIEIRIGEWDQVETADGWVEGIEIQGEYRQFLNKLWMDRKGNLLKEESGLGGLTMVSHLEDRAAACSVTGSAAELIVKSRIRPAGEMPREGFVTRLHLEISGINREACPVLPEPKSSRDDVLSWVLQAGPDRAAVSPSDATPAALMPYLAPSVSITSEDPAIIQTARKIVGEWKTDPQRIRAVWNWVHERIRKEITVGYPSASDVLRTRRGDCNEHAVLLAALCRASGIPCRSVAGIVAQGGFFYYHAWNEVYLAGQDAWLPVDAALGQFPADATHLRMVEGDPSDQIGLVSHLGRLSITILSTEMRKTAPEVNLP